MDTRFKKTTLYCAPVVTTLSGEKLERALHKLTFDFYLSIGLSIIILVALVIAFYFVDKKVKNKIERALLFIGIIFIIIVTIFIGTMDALLKNPYRYNHESVDVGCSSILLNYIEE